MNLTFWLSVLSITTCSQKELVGTKMISAVGMQVRFEFALSSIPRTPWQGFWGTGEIPGKTIVKSANITFGGARLSLRRSAFSDLTNVYSMKHIAKGKKLIVTLKGADSADSYVATFYFEGGELIRRKVQSGEFPHEVWEETKYVNLQIKD